MKRTEFIKTATFRRFGAVGKRTGLEEAGLLFSQSDLTRAGYYTRAAAFRSLELLVSPVVLLLLALPVFIRLAASKVVSGQRIFLSQRIVGLGGAPLTVYRFNLDDFRFRNLPLFFQVLTGRLALVGMPMEPWGGAAPLPEHGYLRRLKPGIVSLWDLRNRSGIAHEGKNATNWEYCFRSGGFSDMLLLLRFFPALILGSKGGAGGSRVTMLGVEFSTPTMETAVSIVADAARDRRRADTVYFVNPDCLNKAVSDKAYREILRNGDHVFPDGIGITLAGKLLGTPLRENLNGTDMLPFIMRAAEEKGLGLFFLGGRPGVAEAAADNLGKQFRARILGTRHGYFDPEKEGEEVIDEVNRSGADILMVGFGAPLQERWIHRNRERLGAGVAMGVGGLFDFYSGRIKRAPRWLREMGLEWVFRFLQEPGRMWRRYVIGNPLFLLRVIFARIFSSGSPAA